MPTNRINPSASQRILVWATPEGNATISRTWRTCSCLFPTGTLYSSWSNPFNIYSTSQQVIFLLTALLLLNSVHALSDWVFIRVPERKDHCSVPRRGRLRDGRHAELLRGGLGGAGAARSLSTAAFGAGSSATKSIRISFGTTWAPPRSLPPPASTK